MDCAVKFENVYKEYPFYQHITAGFKSFLFHLPKNIASLKKTRFIALKDISLEVRKGETFGIIGRNGSGKSTILGLIAGVIRQDKGSMITTGKISSLLELGAGFHPDLSGVENIILNGILMGNTRQDMLKKIDSIIDFSELGDFIYQPLRTYSSGMYIRLGFSVAVHIDPEILLIDEALAVGDLSFQEKCLKKIMAFKESRATIIIVSHDMSMIAKLCDRAAWLDSGSIQTIGKPGEVIIKYVRSLGHEIPPALLEELIAADMKFRLVSSEPSVSQQTEDQLESRPEELPISKEESDSQNIQDVSDMVRREVLWWDSPFILQLTEANITGDPGTDFYQFLKKGFIGEPLEKGLSICRRLQGIKSNFILHNVCASFDTVDIDNKLFQSSFSALEWKENYYDLSLCIDILSHIGDLDIFLDKMNHALKEKGYIIAMEYIGPPNFQWSDNELDIANTIYKAFNDMTHSDNSSQDSFSSISLFRDNDDQEIAKNSMNVIPFMKKYFDILSIKYFGSPLYELVLNKILNKIGLTDEKDATLIKTVIQCEQAFIKKGVLENCYALIIAKKRIS